MPRGISLIEVLIAIFITAVGLLAVAALIPIGTHYSAEANKSIRGWDMGQLATRQIQVHDMLNPNRWVDAGGYRPLWDSAFVVDPYFFARNESVYAADQAAAHGNQRYWFPYASADDVNQSGPAADYQVARMSLRTWRHGPAMFAEPFNDTNGNRTRDAGEAFFDLPDTARLITNGQWDDRGPIAEALFSGHDDSVFAAPNEDSRPLPLNMVEDYTDTDGNGTYDLGEPFADLNGDGLWTDQLGVGTSTGDYSWFITASPASYPVNNNTYIVSVVVCYKRATNFAPLAEVPGERTVFADVENDGHDALLHYTANGTDYLDIKAGQWLMLSVQTQAWNPSTATTVTKKHLGWYRIISVGEREDDPPGANQVRRRKVTLAGGDLNTALFVDQSNATPDLDPLRLTLNLPTFHATIVTGVVNVFERTVEIQP